MSARSLLLLLGLAGVSLVLLAQREAASPAPAAAHDLAAARPAASRATGPAVDPAAIRDVFRFAERPPAGPRPADRGPAHAATSPALAPSPTPDPVRLVGLVRRQGRLLAAFSVDGDVVLAGPGEAVGAITVLEVGEDGVRIRRRDGVEERLALP